MHIDQLKYLIEIGKCPSLNSASQNLNLTYNGLRYSINELEEELGVKLLNRTNKGCTLTKDGERLVRISEKFLSELSLITDKKQKKNISGEITIFVPRYFLESFFSKFIFEIEEKYPKLKIKNLPIENENNIHKIFSQYPDAFCIFTSPADDSHNEFLSECRKKEILFHELYSAPLYCGCVRSHKLANKQDVSIKQLSKYTLLHRVDVKDRLYTQYFNKCLHKIEENPFVFENTILAGKCIFLSTKIPIAPYFTMTHEGITHIPITDAPNIKIYLAHSQKLHRKEHVLYFINEFERKFNCKITLDQ
ncbi:MAG: LysR family transcriptional regulator [Peptococcaceae bacterium]|nr:LysR family transcriptional regulator [Peptococcaceae bacterium]